MYYLIEERLVESDKKQIRTADAQFVAVLTSAQWKTEKDSFDMGIDIEPDSSDIHSTKAEVNYDSLTGSFAVPSREKPSQIEGKFAFALDEKGIVFIDDSGTAEMLILTVQLERFLYDFLEQIVKRDRDLLEHYDKELDAMEGAISNEKGEMVSERVNEIRTEIRDLRVHYEQLLDFGQELEENENSFFKQDNLRYFRLFSNRIDRLRDSAVAISDHASQIRDIYKAHLDIKQNRIMTVLTIVTTIFMPLTLIAGWYGMNFRYMPELDSEWGYPIAITVSLLIVVGSLVFFKLKKWL